MHFFQRFRTSSELPKSWLWMLGVGLFVQMVGELFNNDGSRHATQMYLLLFVPALVLLISQRFALVFWKQMPGVLLLCLLGWVFLYGAMNPGSQNDVGYWAKVVLLVSLYLFSLASLVRHPRAFMWLLIAVVVVAAAFSWLTIYYQFGVLDKKFEYKALRNAGRFFQLGWRGFADLGHPVVAGLYFGVFAVLLTYLFVGCKLRIWQGALLVLAACGVFGYVLLSFSRGAWFSTMAGGLALLLLYPNFKSKSLIGLGSVVLMLAIYFFWPEFQYEQQRGVTGRDQIWQSWFERLPEFWLFGAGADAQFIAQVTFPWGKMSVQHAHSFYLQFWYEYGVVGLLLFMMLVLSLLHKGWQCRSQPLARLGLALMVYSLVAMVSDVDAIFTRPGSSWWVVVWLPIGILLGVRPPVVASHVKASV